MTTTLTLSVGDLEVKGKASHKYQSIGKATPDLPLEDADKAAVDACDLEALEASVGAPTASSCMGACRRCFCRLLQVAFFATAFALGRLSVDGVWRALFSQVRTAVSGATGGTVRPTPEPPPPKSGATGPPGKLPNLPKGEDSTGRPSGKMPNGENRTARPSDKLPNDENRTARPSGKLPNGQKRTGGPSGKSPNGKHSKGRPSGKLPNGENKIDRPNPFVPLLASGSRLPNFENKRIRVLKTSVVNQLGMKYMKTGFGKWLYDAAFTANLCLFCTDEASFSWCKSVLAQPDNCLRTRLTLGDSHFRLNKYDKILWMKWHSIRYALQLPGVKSVFHIDADVAILRPFDELVNNWDYDFMFQAEDAPARYLNGGQLWFNRTNITFRYIEKVLEHEGGDRLDQVYAIDSLRFFPKLRWTHLPTYRFHAQCMLMHAGTSVTSFTRTFHTACGTAREKVRQMADAHISHATPGPISHIIPDNRMCCVQGRANYLQERAERIEASSIAYAHRETVVARGTCASAGYNQNSTAELCFPTATLHTKSSRPIKNMSDSRTIASCFLKALKHGVVATSKGTAEFCMA